MKGVATYRPPVFWVVDYLGLLGKFTYLSDSDYRVGNPRSMRYAGPYGEGSSGLTVNPRSATLES